MGFFEWVNAGNKYSIEYKLDRWKYSPCDRIPTKCQEKQSTPYNIPRAHFYSPIILRNLSCHWKICIRHQKMCWAPEKFENFVYLDKAGKNFTLIIISINKKSLCLDVSFFITRQWAFLMWNVSWQFHQYFHFHRRKQPTQKC